MICNPQLLSEDGESQTESLPSRVKSVRKQTERLRGSSRAPLSKERGRSWGRDRGGLLEGRGEIDKGQG